MFDFLKLCNYFEKLPPLKRAALLAEKSVKVIAGLKDMNVDGIDAVDVLASFLIGSIVCDGNVNEVEYLLIYPSLVRIFGDDFDYNTIKAAFKGPQGKKAVKECVSHMEKIFAALDEEMRRDVFALSLCAVAVDGKISLKERMYLRKLGSIK